jgi:hypothetical protein
MLTCVRMHRRHVITQALGLVAAEVTAGALAGEPGAAADGAGPASALERAAHVTIVNAAFAPGDVRRYGARGDGATDDAAAWRAALSTGHRVLGGDPALTYCLDSHIPVTRAAVIDLQGATLRPRGNARAFVRDPAAATASSEVTAGATQGSRTLSVSNSGGFHSGQWLRLALNDFPAHDPSSYPPGWSRIVAVRGNAIDLDCPLQVSYGSGKLRALASDPELVNERFECRNGIFDGVDCSHDATSGQALRIGGVERVVIEGCEFVNFRHAGAMTCPVQVYVAVDVLIGGCTFRGNLSRNDVCDIQDARLAQFIGNVIDGSHFGCDVLRADALLFANNSLHGQRAREAAEGITPPRSTRGLKAYGCAAARVLGNSAADYESPIKVQACFRYDVSHNTLFNCGLAPYSGQIALNVGSIQRGSNMHAGRIMGNHVESCGGIGIGVTSDAAGGVIVSGNVVRATQGMGIYVAVANATICANRVEDWGLRRAGDAAISLGGAATVADNRFTHGTLNSVPCILAPSRSDARSVMRDNVSEAGNPLYA